MNALQNVKWVGAIWPAAVKNNTAHTSVAYIDTLGYDYATFVFSHGVTDASLSAINIAEGDTTSPATEVAATDFTDATQTDIAGSALAIPGTTADNTITVIQLDLRKRKRYLKALATTGADGTTGAYLSCVCCLSQAEKSPTTAANAGAAVIVRA